MTVTGTGANLSGLQNLNQSWSTPPLQRLHLSSLSSNLWPQLQQRITRTVLLFEQQAQLRSTQVNQGMKRHALTATTTA